MGLGGSELFYRVGGGAQQLHDPLRATLKVYEAMGRPFGPTCLVKVDWSNIGHMLEVSTLPLAMVRLFWRYQHDLNSLSLAEIDAVKTQMKVLVMGTLQSFKVEGVVTVLLVESSLAPRLVLLMVYVVCLFVFVSVFWFLMLVLWGMIAMINVSTLSRGCLMRL